MYNNDYCNQNQSVMRAKRQTDIFEDSPLFDIFLNPTENATKDIMEELVSAPLKTYFEAVSLAQVYPAIFQLLWYSQLPCFPTPGVTSAGLVSECRLGDQTFDCRDLFQTVPTDSGMCCAFNMDTSALKHSLYKELIQDMREKNNETENRGEFEIIPGKRNGLRVMLDNHQNKVTFGSVFDDALGMQVFVGEPEEFPMMSERGKILAPGLEHFLELSGYIVEADAELKSSLGPSQRRCVFPDESELDYFTKYTFSTCKLECGIKHLEKIIGCVPWFFPQGVINSITIRNKGAFKYCLSM